MYDDQYDDPDAVYTVAGAIIVGLASLAGFLFLLVGLYLVFA